MKPNTLSGRQTKLRGKPNNLEVKPNKLTGKQTKLKSKLNILGMKRIKLRSKPMLFETRHINLIEAQPDELSLVIFFRKLC